MDPSLLSWSELLTCLREEPASRTDSLDASNDECWRELRHRIRQHAERLLAERHSFHSEDVEDIVQAVLLKFQSPGTLRRVEAAQSPQGYLVVMIRNAAIDMARRRRVEQESTFVLDQAISGLEEIHGPLEKQQKLGWLAREIQCLKPSERALLYMRFWKGLRISQIAETMGVPYSRIAVRLFRLLRKLEGRSRAAKAVRQGGLRTHPPS